MNGIGWRGAKRIACDRKLALGIRFRNLCRHRGKLIPSLRGCGITCLLQKVLVIDEQISAHLSRNAPDLAVDSCRVDSAGLVLTPDKIDEVGRWLGEDPVRDELDAPYAVHVVDVRRTSADA